MTNEELLIDFGKEAATAFKQGLNLFEMPIYNELLRRLGAAVSASRPYEIGLNERLKDPVYAAAYAKALIEDGVSASPQPEIDEPEYDESESPTNPRDLAVEIVDRCCGYTMENSSSPSHHRYLYSRVTSSIHGIVNLSLRNAAQVFAAAPAETEVALLRKRKRRKNERDNRK